MEEWESRMLDGAVADGHADLEYVWSYRYGDEVVNTKYIIDLIAMTQTNDTTGFMRPMLYIPFSTSQSVLSPFNRR